MGKNTKKNQKNKAKKKAAADAAKVEEAKSTDTADELKAVETIETEDNGVDAAPSIETEAAATVEGDTKEAAVEGEKKSGDAEVSNLVPVHLHR